MVKLPSFGKQSYSRYTRINHSLVKFFVAYGISFRTVKHHFFVNFIKELNAGYNPPTREVLVNQLLERELAQVNHKTKSELERETNLTLGLLNITYNYFNLILTLFYYLTYYLILLKI